MVKTPTLCLVAVAVIGAGGASSAQTLVPNQVQSETLHQVRVFETNLRSAIERAGQRLAGRAREVVSDITLSFVDEARVYGSLLPEGEGAIFFVEVPGIAPDAQQLWSLLRRLQDAPPVSRLANPVPPPPPGTVKPNLTDADPVIAPMTEPDREYGEFTRQALVDAMLDNAFALPLRAGQTLTVVAMRPPTPQLAGVDRKLYLRVNAEDLIALRENRITRDEAKLRIREFRY